MIAPYWMIENLETDAPSYWTGTWGHTIITEKQPWTIDPDKAVHFERAQDAQAVRDGVIAWPGARITPAQERIQA
jgi:hypothetical protein